MKNIDYSSFDPKPTEKQIQATHELLQSKALKGGSGQLLIDEVELKIATSMRLFAKKNGFMFFGSVQRPVPYDFILETTYAHTYSWANILYGFVMPLGNGWLEIGQYENRDSSASASHDFMMPGSPQQTTKPFTVPGEVYFRLYPGCALPGIEIVANDDFELLLERRNSQKHVLEGNFSDYFTVFADDLSTLEVREVLTPNVMAVLIDEFVGTSIELSEKGLFTINANFSLNNRKNIKYTVQYALRLSERLLYQIMDTVAGHAPMSVPKSSDHYISTNSGRPFSWWSVAKFLISLGIGAIIILILIVADPNTRAVFFH